MLSADSISFSGGEHDSSQAESETILGPKRPRPHKIWKKRYVKLLVVGDSGLGKTTLIRCLLSTPNNHLELHDGTETSPEQFRRDPRSLCSTITWKDEEDRIEWFYKIQDTPGYGDDLNIWNNIQSMLAYVEQQNRAWLHVEQDRKRTVPLSDLEDPRVDLCLFCLPPHRLRPVDLRYMAELGHAVPILPIITKADTMTTTEAEVYRQEVYAKLNNPAMPGVRALRQVLEPINVFQFAEATRARAGLEVSYRKNTPPFLVVAANVASPEKLQQDPPEFWPVRIYPWGTCEAFNVEHSDLYALRALLTKEGLEEICATKRLRYEHWRVYALMPRRLRKLVKVLVVAGVVAGGLFLKSHSGSLKEMVRSRLYSPTAAVPEESQGSQPIPAKAEGRRKFLGLI